MNNPSPRPRRTGTHDPCSPEPRRKLDVCRVITLLVLSICVPLGAARAQRCPPHSIHYIVRDEKGNVLDAQALASIREGMRGDLLGVGTLYLNKDGKTFHRSFQEGKTDREMSVLFKSDLHRCRVRVSETTLTYRGKTMRLLFNVDIPGKEMRVRNIVIDAIPFQEGTFKLNLSEVQGDDLRVVPAWRWEKVGDKP